MLIKAHRFVALLVVAAAACGCRSSSPTPKDAGPTPQPESPTVDHEERDVFADVRRQMVAEQIAGRDVRDPRVLQAMREVPRHEFVPYSLRLRAYGDHPLPIGKDQTISQPYIVAKMTELANLGAMPHPKVLEVGTGSGYQAAVLAALGAKVFSIEIVPELSEEARKDLERAGYSDRVELRVGDGYKGWPEEAPFDAILVTAAPDHVPEPLVDQLAEGARLVIPVGDQYQDMMVVTKTPEGVVEKVMFPVRFVPMTGEAQEIGH